MSELPALVDFFGRPPIAALGFGTVPLIYSSRDRTERIEVLREVLDGEVCYVDTADVYSRTPGAAEAEEILGSELRGRPDRRRHLIGTKCGFVAEATGVRPCGDPVRLALAANASLRRLGGEALDLLFLHTPDPAVPFADSLGALADLADAGKVRYIGLSNVSVVQIREAARVLGQRLVCVQNRLDLETQGQRVVLDECKARGLSYLAAAPLGGMGHRRRSASSYRVAQEAAHGRWNAEQEALNTMLSTWPGILPVVGVSSRASLSRWRATNQSHRATGSPMLQNAAEQIATGTPDRTGVHS
jgi:aryl-alcohol dehydrogenase-like predicted oxidoreductase